MKTENMPKKLKDIPKFNNEDEEREFWAKEDSTDFVDWDSVQSQTLPKLKRSNSTKNLNFNE